MKTALRSTALAIILIALTGIFDAHADCPLQSDYAAPHTRTDFVKGGLVYDLTKNELKTCDGTNWNTVAAGSGLAGGTSGYLGVWTGATTMGLSSTAAGQNLFWDGTNHRLGIGTTDPTQQLQVSGALLAGGAASTFAADGIYLQNKGGSIFDIGAWRSGASAGILTFSTDGGSDATPVERMRINQVGNVGIGTANPAAKLQIDGNPGSNIFLNTTGSGPRQASLRFGDGGADKWQWRYHPVDTGDSLLAYSYTLGADVLTLAGSGRVGIGTTTPLYTLEVVKSASVGWAAGFRNPSGTGGGIWVGVGPDTADASTLVGFYNATGSQMKGSITRSGASSVQYNTGSDLRLKEDITPTALGIDDLMRIRVRDFAFKADLTHQRTTGFIAQELNEIFPGAVRTNGDDGTSELKEGTAPWQVDYGRVTPLIVRAVQDLKAENDNLRAELQAANDNDEKRDAAIRALKQEIDALKAAR